MSSKPAFERFEGTAQRYAQFRPVYPPSLLQALQDDLRREPPVGGVVLDVGAGTGIFTRQLRAILADDVEVIGIEPGSDMRNSAISSSQGLAKLRYIEGTAEKLPIVDRAARAVLSATAAHWFDRPRYYAEVARVLMPGGLFAIVHYLRDIKRSPAAASAIELLERLGNPVNYARPDYAAELHQLDGFGEFDRLTQDVTFQLSPDQFVGLILSSSYARPAIERLGQQQAEEVVYRKAHDLQSADGKIPYGFIFQAFTARRKP